MKRTDDFLADLEAQLGAAAAGQARRHAAPRLRPFSLLRPALLAATAAAAAFAFVLAAGTGSDDPERAAEPPAVLSSGSFPLQMAHRGQCAADPGDADLAGLSVLKRPAGAARADAPVHVVAMEDVGSCVFDGSSGPGACVNVELAGTRTACWALREIEAGHAVAGLGEGFVVALLPDRFREVTFVIGTERDTYPIVDNVVVGNLEAAQKGAQMELLAVGGPRPGCIDARSEEGPLPGELLVAVPILREARSADAPRALAARLAKAGAKRMWLDEARRIEGDGASEAWVVPVADSVFAECSDPLVIAPRVFEGPGACLAIMHADEPKSVLCAPLDQLNGVATAPVPGGRVAVAFLPHGAHTLEIEGTRLSDSEPPAGVVFGAMPDRDTYSFDYLGAAGPIDPGDLGSRSVAVLAPTEEISNAVVDRLRREGLTAIQTSAAPAPEASHIRYAAGMARAAHQLGEVLRVHDVRPLDPATEGLADRADLVVVAGEDLRP